MPRQQVASLAMQVNKANVRSAAALPLSRYFSQTARAAQEEQENATVESAMGSAAESEQSSTSTPRDAEQPKNVVFVSNMTFDATDVHLREAFSQYGDIVSINIGRDGRGLSRGFGFVHFKDEQSANKAVAGADKSFWHGRRINVAIANKAAARSPRSARGEEPREPTSSLYIGNIPYETSDAELNAIFKELENVVDVRVAIDRNTGWPRGFAHADFKDVESAVKAYEKLSQTEIGNRSLRCDYSQPRETLQGRRQ
ncbi:hypothetical protein DL766_002027 [Monosporascus sp. MC13-8B]|uniref:RRM domain-containing protein n=1 Tax=Monosporascus cannonballus TaxID=155416 RepID=A0ABY0HEG4_9PEZI|nr:hypothetical protein DL762_002288 [Monosporascus cannonballus]RYO94984.1 hypothetical protein DL763_003880 [Monosporascus cannonballus]RYP36365.1 hypothetical protein DL766_002027 [Monosporascus sp. MC13-8B]